MLYLFHNAFMEERWAIWYKKINLKTLSENWCCGVENEVIWWTFHGREMKTKSEIFLHYNPCKSFWKVGVGPKETFGRYNNPPPRTIYQVGMGFIVCIIYYGKTGKEMEGKRPLFQELHALPWKSLHFAVAGLISAQVLFLRQEWWHHNIL